MPVEQAGEYISLMEVLQLVLKRLVLGDIGNTNLNAVFTGNGDG